MNFNDIFIKSFNETINKIFIDLPIDSLVKINFPNPLTYIKISNNNCASLKQYARNHPRLREIDDFNLYDQELYKLKYGSYNYAIIKDTFTNKFHIIFGKVTSCLELGVKHSIISKGFPIYLAGEIKKSKQDESTDLIQFNFNSSNFGVEAIRNKVFVHLFKINQNHELINTYSLKKNSTNKSNDIEYAMLLRLFYDKIIKPFAESIFRTIANYPENHKVDFQFVIAEQDVYKLTRNLEYYKGLHDCYSTKICYNDEIMTNINKKGNPKNISNNAKDEETDNKEDDDISTKRKKLQTHSDIEISRMCIDNNTPKLKCKQDTLENKIDVLDELFIQLIYQYPILSLSSKPLNQEFITNNIINAIIDSNLTTEKPDIDFFLSKWISRYIQKNFIFLFDFFNSNNLTKVKTIESEEKNVLYYELIIIKILFYGYLKLILQTTIDNCSIYKLDSKVDRYYKLIINGEIYNLKFKSNYIFKIKIKRTNIYYDVSNIQNIYISNTNTNKNLSTFNPNFFINYINLDQTIFTPTHNIDELITKNPLPIDYISFKNKYLKYKNKYLSLKLINKN